MNAKHLVVVLALAAAGLSACATPQAPTEPLPAEVAQRLETVRRERTAFPSFADLPPPPRNLRSPPQWAAAVQAVETRGAVVGSWPERNPAWITDVAGDAARLQAQTRLQPGDIPPPDQVQRTEAFARTLRQRTEPPPPIEN